MSHVLNTHHHYDHTDGNRALKEKTGCLVIGAAADAGRIPGLDRPVREGDRIAIGTSTATVLETPGHTPGHVSFHLPEEGIIFVGDTLFAGSIGRTDFPGGSYTQLIRSVQEKIFTLDGDTVVYPGHGPRTTVERERRSNPFFR